ncbi:MAG: hypothetical protein Fur0015_06910 [Ignavibacteriales bacterium]
MSIFQGHVGVNLSSAKLEVVGINYAEKRCFVENVDEEYFSEFINFNDKETKIISILQQAFDNILIRNSFTSTNISFSIPSHLFKIFEIPFESDLHKDDLANHLEWEFGVLFPFLKKEDYLLRHIKLNEEIRKQKVISIFAIERRIINILNKFAARNNFILKYVDNEHVAANTAIFFNEPTLENAISFYIGFHHFTILVTNKNLPVYFRRKTFKSFAEFSTEFDEEFKLMKIKLSEDFVIEKLFLFGDKYPTNIVEIITSKFELDPNYLNPFEQLNAREEIKESKFLINNPATFSSAAGMAFRLI